MFKSKWKGYFVCLGVLINDVILARIVHCCFLCLILEFKVMRFGNICTLLLVSLFLACVPALDGADFSDPLWKFSLEDPGDGWESTYFDDSGWKQGAGGFGDASTPGSRVGTEWLTNDIWIRRRVSLEAVPAHPALLIHHDEDAEVFVNGRSVGQFEGFVTEYKVVPLSPEFASFLKKGGNLIAVHCHQTGGGQFIDVHLIDANKIPTLPRPKQSNVPFKSELITKWGKQVNPENVWQEYPRPLLQRQNWQNLNGLWKYAVTDNVSSIPSEWDGDILVPFCIESKLSGVQRLLQPEETLWYKKIVSLYPESGKLMKLNFEAVDYACTVWVNGENVGGHVGGNTPFSLDITKVAKSGANEIIVKVRDSTGGTQLRGKQRLDPRGIWYTRVSGIWQTVWVEQVSKVHFKDIKISTDIRKGTVTLHPILANSDGLGYGVRALVRDGAFDKDEQGTTSYRANGPLDVTLTIENPTLWSPDEPKLYPLQVVLKNKNGEVVDHISSYVGLREVGTIRGDDGHLRFTLNGKTIFHWGTLDQGWWPDGLLTPPSDEGMAYDVEYLRDAGFNMIRKHIKVEPRRYYYHCDRLGVMLWQDQVSAIKNPPWTRLKPDPEDAEWTDAEHRQYMIELERMIDTLENHPSIVVWVPFNEAWGQHRTMAVGAWTVNRDPSRHVNIASGGNFWPSGHIVDAHAYPQPEFPFDADRYDADFIKVMGEFGGHGWPVLGHLWDNSRRNWGYGGLPKTVEEYKERYRESIRRLADLKTKGISAGVYTQTTDVEGEINGLLTYDREVPKIPASELRQIHRTLFE